MTLTQLFDSILGPYNPIMVTNYLALDIPYLLKGVFVLILLWGVISAMLTAIKGVFRRW